MKCNSHAIDCTTLKHRAWRVQCVHKAVHHPYRIPERSHYGGRGLESRSRAGRLVFSRPWEAGWWAPRGSLAQRLSRSGGRESRALPPAAPPVGHCGRVLPPPHCGPTSFRTAHSVQVLRPGDRLPLFSAQESAVPRVSLIHCPHLCKDPLY